MQALLWLALAVIFIFIIFKMTNLSKRIEELETNTLKRTDSKLTLLFRRLEELEKEIRQLKGLAKLPKPPEPSPPEEISIEEEEIEAPQIIPPQPPPLLTPQAQVPPSPPVTSQAQMTPSKSPSQAIRRAQVSSSECPSTGPVPEPARIFTFETETKPSRTREEWEALIGGKLLNRIGALALIIGIGFFLKYAFDKHWLTETMRVLIGIVIGAVLLWVGSRSYKKELRIFAQGLIGAGISILYLSVYASFNFYHLVPQVIAFLMMSVVTVITFSRAFKYDSLAVSLLGWAGGFLTPFLLSTGRANEVGLFTYIALLDVGLLIVLVRKDSWIILEPLTFGATYLTYLLWYLKFYAPADLGVTVLFLSIFWGLFFGLDVYRIVTSNTEFRDVRQIIATFNAGFYFWAMYTIVNPSYHNWMALITLGIGAVYFITVLGLKRRWPDDTMILARYFLTAIALLIGATTIQFSGFTTAIYWSLEAMILVWCGIRWRLIYVWVAALSLFCLALIKLLVTEGALAYVPIQNFTLLLNRRALTFSLLTATLGISAHLFKDVNEKNGEFIRTALQYTWCILLFVFCTVETNDYFHKLMSNPVGGEILNLEFTHLMMFSAVWMIYSLLLVWLGLRRNIMPALYCGLGALVASVLLGAGRGISFQPIQSFSVVLNLRAAVLLLLILASLLQERWLAKRHEDYSWMGNMQIILQFTVCILIFLLCTVETNDYFRMLMSNTAGKETLNLEFTRLMMFSAVWITYSLLSVGLGLRRNIMPALYCGLGALGASVLLGAGRGISFQPIQSFSVVLNLRAAVLFLLILASLLQERWLAKRHEDYRWMGDMRIILQFTVCILIFLLCTVETNDYFRRHMIHAGGLLRDSLEFNRLMILAAIWTIYSLPLVWYGLRKHLSSLLYPGLCAFALAVLFGGIRGITFEPIQNFMALINIRAIVLFLIIIGAFAHFQWFNKHRQTYSWIEKALKVLQVILILLILELVTGEIWDYFGKPISLLSERRLSSGFISELKRLTNLRQLSISGSWLIYSIILMRIGIWRRTQRLRIISIILFGVTILKIFIYDLSFLETLYRIFSFVGLGLILLATSYLYQRYRSVIFDTGKADTAEGFGSESHTGLFRKDPEEEVMRDQASPKFKTREEYDKWKAEKLKNPKG